MGFMFLHIFWVRHSLPILLNSFFKVICIERETVSCSKQRTDLLTALEDRDSNLPHEQKEGRLVRIKGPDPLCSEFFWNTSHCMYWGSLALFTSPGGNWVSGNWCKNAETLAIAIDLSSKSSFISDPGASYPLPASMNLCQASWLAYK